MPREVQRLRLADLVPHSPSLAHMFPANGQTSRDWVRQLARSFDARRSGRDPIIVSYGTVDGELRGHVEAGQHRILALILKYGPGATLGQIPAKAWRATEADELARSFLRNAHVTMAQLFAEL